MTIWNKHRIKEYANFTPGYAFDSNIFRSEGVPVIKISNIKNGYIDMEDSSTQFVDEHYLKTINSKYQIKNGDVLISLTGSHLTQPNSVVGRVGRYRYKNTALLNQRALKIKAIKSKCDNGFLYYLLSSSTLRKEIALMAQGAANQANVSHKDIEKIFIFCPPLPIQKKIAAVLSTYDDLIENNNRRIAILEKMAEEIYREWFVRMRFPGHEKVKFHKGVPEGWEIKEVKDTNISIVDGDRGVNYPKKEEFDSLGYCLFLNTGNMQNDAFNFTKCDFITKKRDSLLRKGRVIINDIVLTTRGTVGNIAFYNKNSLFKNIRINSGMVILRLKQKSNNSLYYYYLFKSPLLKEQYKLYSSGAAQPQLPIKDLKRIHVLIPSEKIINNFCNLIESFNTQTEKLRVINNILTHSRDLLLSRLISGKLSVEDLDIKFPSNMEEESRGGAENAKKIK